MPKDTIQTDQSEAPTGQAHGDRVFYLLQENEQSRKPEDELSLREAWDIIWRGKWLIVSVTTVLALASISYALLATEWYRAEVLLAPADARATPTLAGQLGGLAALAGVTVGGGDSAEPIAVLKSRGFARSFVEDFDLTRTFFAEEWDAENNRWAGSDSTKWPDVRDAVTYFHERVLSVNVDRNTGLVTLAIEWKNAELAAKWAEELVERLNAKVRGRALSEAEENVTYLQNELMQTNVVTLQQSIGRLLENELQKLMLAKGNEEFAFKILDPPQAPKEPVRPRRLLISVIGTMLGALLGVIAAFGIQSMRRE
jgi:uncharacterized protein involved in exopolysaccharide biosynthesis